MLALRTRCPYRNVDPSWFEIAVSVLVGALFGAAAVFLAINAVAHLRKSRD